MAPRRLTAIGLAVGACLGGMAGTAIADEMSPGATQGSVPVDGPLSCDANMWWDTNGHPIAGATVPNPTYCVAAVTDALARALTSDHEVLPHGVLP